MADLEDIFAYLTEHSPQGAQRVDASILAIERLLADHPLSGRKTRLDWLRRIKTSAYPYYVFYEATDTEVVIHAVRHAARDPRSMPGSS